MAHFYAHTATAPKSPIILSAGLLGWFGFTLSRTDGLTWYLRAGSGFLAWGTPADYDEVVVWQAGPLVLTRAETEEERVDREWAEEEAAYLDSIADYYSY